MIGRDLHDPANRRFRHPFITCSDCGPRFTIIRALPYDRLATAMAPFVMCTPCQAEYRSPDGRRFHAEPIACLQCGPQLWLELAGSDQRTATGDHALIEAVRLVGSGGILAVKGVGGFHLICDATSNDAVSRLRARKRRPRKPFAVVVADPERARRVGHWSEAAMAALTSPARPIVIVDVLDQSDLAQSVNPGLRQIGLMVPHSPLHDLLLRDWAGHVADRPGQPSGALVMTSANRPK